MFNVGGLTVLSGLTQRLVGGDGGKRHVDIGEFKARMFYSMRMTTSCNWLSMFSVIDT